MIQVVRPKEPDYLKNHHPEWRVQLLEKLDELRKSGIIDDEQLWKHKQIKNILSKYGHAEIRKELRSMCNNKCVYCERILDENENDDWIDEIEHFWPKSIYPEACFEWSNLFLACQTCNRAPNKHTHDTKREPIVNPELDDPEAFFFWNVILIDSDNEIGKRTIRVCGLDKGVLLLGDLGMILGTFQEKEKLVEGLIDDWLEKQIQIKPASKTLLKNRIEKLRKALIDFKQTGNKDKKFAGFMRYHINHSDIIKRAVSYVNDNTDNESDKLEYPFSWD